MVQWYQGWMLQGPEVVRHGTHPTPSGGWRALGLTEVFPSLFLLPSVFHFTQHLAPSLYLLDWVLPDSKQILLKLLKCLIHLSLSLDNC